MLTHMHTHASTVGLPIDVHSHSIRCSHTCTHTPPQGHDVGEDKQSQARGRLLSCATRYIRLIAENVEVGSVTLMTALPGGVSIVGVAQTAAAIFESLYEECARDVSPEVLPELERLWLGYAMMWA
jgi:hypothetical protein